MKFLENVIKKHESEVVMLEEEKVRQAKVRSFKLS